VGNHPGLPGPITPGGEAGGNGAPPQGWNVDLAFQSAPGGEAGGNQRATFACSALMRFQSAPGGEAGGNHQHHGDRAEARRV